MLVRLDARMFFCAKSFFFTFCLSLRCNLMYLSIFDLKDNCGFSCFLSSLRRAEPQCLFLFNRCLINGILFSSLSGRVASTRCPPFPSALRSHVCSVLSERDTLPPALKALSEFNPQTDAQGPKALKAAEFEEYRKSKDTKRHIFVRLITAFLLSFQ